jgi:hypothetical protein
MSKHSRTRRINSCPAGAAPRRPACRPEASSDTLEVKLGSKSGGTIGKVTSSAATLNTDSNLTDEFGNLFPAFTTATTAQF